MDNALVLLLLGWGLFAAVMIAAVSQKKKSSCSDLDLRASMSGFDGLFPCLQGQLASIVIGLSSNSIIRTAVLYCENPMCKHPDYMHYSTGACMLPGPPPADGISTVVSPYCPCVKYQGSRRNDFDIGRGQEYVRVWREQEDHHEREA